MKKQSTELLYHNFKKNTSAFFAYSPDCIESLCPVEAGSAASRAAAQIPIP
jgi:hypothetical protein